MFSHVLFDIKELVKPLNGESPWAYLPISLLKKVDKDLEFYNHYWYVGRNLVDYKMEINFIIRNETINGNLIINDSKIILPSISLNFLGEGYLNATWLNISIHGSGICNITTTVSNGE